MRAGQLLTMWVKLSDLWGGGGGGCSGGGKSCMHNAPPPRHAQSLFVVEISGHPPRDSCGREAQG